MGSPSLLPPPPGLWYVSYGNKSRRAAGLTAFSEGGQVSRKARKEKGTFRGRDDAIGDFCYWQECVPGIAVERFKSWALCVLNLNNFA